VSAGAGVVTDPDSEVLDLERALLVDLKLNELISKIEAPPVLRTTFKLTISPLDFLTLRNFIKKYQKRDFATTVFGAKIRMR
jgi:hypothetical protein